MPCRENSGPTWEKKLSAELLFWVSLWPISSVSVCLVRQRLALELKDGLAEQPVVATSPFQYRKLLPKSPMRGLSLEFGITMQHSMLGEWLLQERRRMLRDPPSLTGLEVYQWREAGGVVCGCAGPLSLMQLDLTKTGNQLPRDRRASDMMLKGCRS